ncbi:MAG: hypothetical protein QM658_04035 [Gordonia sp. (in: high G+C Gram-positive bacteria)]
MNTEHEIKIIVGDELAAEVGPLPQKPADDLAAVLDSLGVEFYRYTRPDEFGVWRFAS